MSIYCDDENSWDFNDRLSDYPKTGQPLSLGWEPAGAVAVRVEDDETADEAFYRWVAEVAREFENGVVPLEWTVETQSECAPFSRIEWQDGDQDFLTAYTVPVNSLTGERVNWSRVPVDHDSTGFITAVTGWTPGPLQPSVRLDFLQDCATAQAALAQESE